MKQVRFTALLSTPNAALAHQFSPGLPALQERSSSHHINGAQSIVRHFIATIFYLIILDHAHMVNLLPSIEIN